MAKVVLKDNYFSGNEPSVRQERENSLIHFAEFSHYVPNRMTCSRDREMNREGENMKRRILIALALVLSLTSFAIPAQKDAPARRMFVRDTGIVNLGPNEVLRLSCVTRDGSPTTVGFRRLEYAQGPCNSGVCTHTVSSDSTTGPVMLMSGEGASVEIPNTAFGVRGMVLSSVQEVVVVCVVFDTSTQRIMAIWNAPLEP